MTIIEEMLTIKVKSISIENHLIRILGHDIDKFKESESILEKLYNEGNKEKAITADTICVVKFQELFERCRAIEIDGISKSARIVLIDSDQNELNTVSLHQLRPIALSSTFCSPDTFCSEYYLAQVYIIGDTEKDAVDNYLNELTCNLCSNEKVLDIQVLKTVSDKRIFKVYSNDIPRPKEAYSKFISIEEQAKMISDYEEKKKSNHQQMRPVARGLKAAALPKFIRQANDCNGEEFFAPQYSYKINALVLNSVHQVRITNIEKNNTFYVQLIALDSRFQEMTSNLQKVPLIPLREKPKAFGLACLAKHHKKIYRVAVLKSHSDRGHEAFLCHFVDYGFFTSVRLESLFNIPNEVVMDEAFALSFNFSGLKNFTFKLNSTEVHYIFRQLTENKLLTLKCVASDGPQTQQYCELYDGKNVNILKILQQFDPSSKRLSPQNKLTLKAHMSVKVCYAQSTNEFYIQNQESKHLLDYDMLYYELQRQMPNAPAIRNVQGGMSCGVPIDGEWFRGEIIRQIGADTVSVKIIDFGVVEEISVKSIRMLSCFFYETPSFAYRCCLKGFENLQVSDNVNTQFDIFCSQICGDGNVERRTFKMFVDDFKPPNYIVELEDESSSPPANVNRILLKNSRPLAETITLENAKKRQKENSTNKKEINNVQAAPTPPKQVVVKEVKLPERNRNSPQRGRGNHKGTQRPSPAEAVMNDKPQRTHFGNKGEKSGNYFNSPKDASSSSMTKSTSSSSFENYQRESSESSKSRKSKSPKITPEKKKREKLKREKSTVELDNKKSGWVSTVVSVNKVYIHFEEDVSALKRILDEMYAFYQNNPDPSKNIRLDSIFAFLSTDGNFYRGKIKNIKGDMCQVFNMEFGNQELITKSKIFNLAPQFEKEKNVLTEAYFAIQGTTCDNDEELLKEMKDLFKDGGVELKFEIVKTFKEGIILEILSEDGKEKYFDQLVAKKIAKRISEEELTRILKAENMLKQVESVVELEVAIASDKEEENELKTSLIRGKITALTSPNDFYLSSFDALENFKELHEDIQVIAPAMSPLLDFECDTYCLAKSPYDNSWYRAKIIDSDQSLISVLCIDNGKTFSFDNKISLKTLPDQMNRKSYGMACSLAVTIERKSEEAATNFMLTAVDKCVEYEIILTTPDKTFVEIKFDGENIKNFLVEKKLAKAFEVFEPGTGYTSHINSPDDFYIQLEQEQVKLELIGSIFERADGKFPKLNNPKENQIVAAKFEDGSWYRARIESIEENGFNVKYIDYGNNSVTKDIGELDKSIAEIPEMSKQCRLLKPKNLLYFSEAAEKKFSEICDNGTTIMHVRVIKPGAVTEVELFCDGKNIIEQLAPLCTMHDNTDDD